MRRTYGDLYTNTRYILRSFILVNFSTNKKLDKVHLLQYTNSIDYEEDQCTPLFFWKKDKTLLLKIKKDNSMPYLICLKLKRMMIIVTLQLQQNQQNQTFNLYNNC